VLGIVLPVVVSCSDPVVHIVAIVVVYEVVVHVNVYIVVAPATIPAPTTASPGGSYC
jgi:hypothetical protein